MSSWFGSKPAAPVVPKAPMFTPDYSTATLSGAELARQLSAASQQAATAVQQATASATASATAAATAKFGWVWPTIKFLFIPVIVILLTVVLYDSLAPDNWPNIFFDKGRSSQPPTVSGQQQATAPPVQASSPPILKKLWSSVTGDSSGDLAPSFHDATTSAVVSASNAPLSAEREGGYGMQWWMYVKDWNYGYGKDKPIIVRPDTTNSAVMNPNITLHPTDNSMRISVSIFPNTEGGAAASQPAAAGHTGSSDDVFVCEVPNIPLQTWFSVGVTVFGRNLDVYIDGKLVKSCFLNGVPKPAVGDIQLTPAGGFSGRMCNFYHYPRMLTPQDALSFWESGTPCKNKTAAGGSSPTGYSVKFGVYDALGKEVTEYAF